MGKIIGVVFAFGVIMFNNEIFTYSSSFPPGPLFSSYIFVVALFLLLCELSVYPMSLRKMGRIPQVIIEMLIAIFLSEIIIVEFWFPLEEIAMENLKRTADIIEEFALSENWQCDTICYILRSLLCRYAVSYALSIFFLTTVLHATRYIDLRALNDGVVCFIKDIITRAKRNFKQTKRSLSPKVFRNVPVNSKEKLETKSNKNEKKLQRKCAREKRKCNTIR